MASASPARPPRGRLRAPFGYLREPLENCRLRNEARGDAVHADVVPRHFQRDIADEADDARHARAYHCLARRGETTGVRGEGHE